MVSIVWLVHILSALVVIAIVVALLAVIVKTKRAHAAEIARLETEIATLKGQNQAWQSAASDI